VEVDVWVDEDGRIHRSKEDYSSVVTSITITSGRSVPLVLKATDETAYVEVSLINGGENGAASFEKSGIGTYEDPLRYELTLYGDDSSNDSVIALLSSDPDLEGEGTDPTHISPVAMGWSALYRDQEDHFETMSIDVIYTGYLPDFLTENESLHPSVPNATLAVEALVNLTAARILESKKRYNDASPFIQLGNQAIETVLYQKGSGPNPVQVSGRRVRR